MPKIRSNVRRRRRKFDVLKEDKIADEELEYLEKVVLGSGNEVFREDESEEEEEEKERTGVVGEEEVKKPAWTDESDLTEIEKTGEFKESALGKKVQQSFRESKFQQVLRKPKWASKASSITKQDSILSRCGNLIKKPEAIEKGMLRFSKVRDLNYEAYIQGPINGLKFHPTATVALVAGLSGVATLFQVDGKENPMLHSMKFDRFPIHCASFMKNGEEFMVGSKFRKEFHSYNLITGHAYKTHLAKIDHVREMSKFVVSPDDKMIAACGDHGKIYILSGRSKECIDSFQMNSNVTSIAFNSSGSKLYSFGEDGQVYIWDMQARRCCHKFVDEGCLIGTAIDVSSDDSLLACGSSFGIINIYEVDNIMSNNFKPTKTIYNLVTEVTTVKFNPTCELLAMSSHRGQNALKFLHLPSMTTFSNFPISGKTPFRSYCIDFSPNSGYFAFGDAVKTAHLFRLHHYGNY